MPQSLELDTPSQALLHDARALTRRKVRKASGTFLAEGRQCVREALGVPGAVDALFVRWSDALANADVIADARAGGVPVYGVSEQNLMTLSDTVTPQGLVAIARLAPQSLDVVRGARLVVVCAQVRDPGNAGTVIRCADAFGADAVVLSEDSVELTNPKTVRASVGTLFHLPVVTGVPLGEALDACRAAGMQVLAADGDSDVLLPDLGDALARPTAWVMGNESWGLPVEHLALADHTVAVPIYGQAESLNLATAAAVCLYASASAQRASN